MATTNDKLPSVSKYAPKRYVVNTLDSVESAIILGGDAVVNPKNTIAKLTDPSSFVIALNGKIAGNVAKAVAPFISSPASDLKDDKRYLNNVNQRSEVVQITTIDDTKEGITTRFGSVNYNFFAFDMEDFKRIDSNLNSYNILEKQLSTELLDGDISRFFVFHVANVTSSRTNNIITNAVFGLNSSIKEYINSTDLTFEISLKVVNQQTNTVPNRQKRLLSRMFELNKNKSIAIYNEVINNAGVDRIIMTGMTFTPTESVNIIDCNISAISEKINLDI